MTGTGCAAGSLAEILCERAAAAGDVPAYAFLPERGAAATLTFAELEARARGVAAGLRRRAEAGERALLLFPPGLDFVVAFYGCLLAGIVAVPMMPPRRDAARDAGAAIIADCAPRLALTSGELMGRRPDLAVRLTAAGVACLTVEAALQTCPWPLPAPRRDDVALLQYTSGSTSAPKGVVVSHANLLRIRR